MSSPSPITSSAVGRWTFRQRSLALWVSYLVFDTASQLAFKWAAATAGHAPFSIDWMRQVLATAGLWVGIGCYIGTLLVWLKVLARTDLSQAFPMSGIAYITVPILAVVLFGESLTAAQVTGIAAICIGVALLATERVEPRPQ